MVTRESNHNALNDAESALALVAEAARAIHNLEDQSARALDRAHHEIKTINERLAHALAQGKEMATSLQRAETRIEDLMSALARAQDEILNLRNTIAHKEDELAHLRHQATESQKQAADARASIQKIVNALRTELPISNVLLGKE